ncbi:MAG: PEP-utilizing enzyme [Candidatus Cloacimonetes bacterium]|nr:PEP-utilizing enzyme [Candidatus Cloacimonadota bacterium]
MFEKTRQFKGLPVSSGIYEGVVKVLKTTADFGKVEVGDVIVVYASSPAWTVPLLKAGALIAEMGGILCHTAIVAREIGVPGIVNIENITNILKDGDRVILNGEEGTLDVLD